MTTFNPQVWPAITIAYKKPGDKFMIEDREVMLAEPYSMANLRPDQGSAFVVDTENGQFYQMPKSTKVDDRKTELEAGDLQDGDLFFIEGDTRPYLVLAKDKQCVKAIRLKYTNSLTIPLDTKVYRASSVTFHME